ncbi:hypothetical protein DFH11DRAFT_1835755 [Phellopilus nigrolimitatus]|nr:hypothetical protein DFH11DRAFT_1835755 [Phellopilus nigrolimitatus]
MSKRVNKRDLSSLPLEVLTKVLRRCDAKSVAQMRGNLDVKQAPNMTPYDHLDNLSAEQMASKVAKTVGSSHRWRTSGENKRYAQEASLRITPFIQLNSDSGDFMRPQLLPGGRYALLVNWMDLQLWSLEHSTCVWVAESPHANSPTCDTFDFELLQGGKVLIIATASSIPGGRAICVYKFDFASQKGTRVFECFIDASLDAPQLMVRGELVMVFHQRRNGIILFNWKKSEAVILDYHHVNTASLVENHHIVIALEVRDRHLKIVAISVSSLDGKWTNVRLYSDWAQWRRVLYSFPGEKTRDVIRLRLPNQSGKAKRRRILGMHAFTPAWYPKTKTNIPGTAEIFVAAYEVLEDKSYHLLSYRVQLSGHAVGVARRAVAAPDIAWRLSLVAQDRAAMKVKMIQPYLSTAMYNISNAGRMFSRYGPKVYCYQLFCKDQQPVGYGQIPGIEDSVFDEENEPMVMSVEPVSSAVLIGSDALLRVARFGS